MVPKSKVSFFFEKKDFTLKDRGKLKAFIEILFKRERKQLESLNYIFCSDKKVLDINRQFLGHDYYTDIITFDLSEKEATNAEIYISTDRVRDNSGQLEVSFKLELLRVIFHGALHLCGFRDKTKAEKQKMRAKEDLYLKLYASFRST